MVTGVERGQSGPGLWDVAAGVAVIWTEVPGM